MRKQRAVKRLERNFIIEEMTYRACDLVVSNCTFWSLLESKFFLFSSPRQKHNFFLSFLSQQVSSSADSVSRLVYRFIPLYFYLLFSIFLTATTTDCI